jgi:CRISPR system Cascade subunit CasA
MILLGPGALLFWVHYTGGNPGHQNRRGQPLDVHPDQHFWAIPRRIFLLNESAVLSQRCDICGVADTKLYRQYLTKNYGVNYEGPWLHPLSPHYLSKDGQPNPVHPQPGGIGYRHWLGLVENNADATRRIARVVEQYRRLQREDGRLWAFGYDMDNMKARCWYEAEMPMIFASEDIELEYKVQIEVMIEVALQVALELRKQVRNALFGPYAQIRGDLSYVDSQFWSETEPAFYTLLGRLRNSLIAREDSTSLLREWYTTLVRTARLVFDGASQTGDFNAADPRRIAIAWNDLNKALARRKLRELLGFAA